jgi:hypothetical protein
MTCSGRVPCGWGCEQSKKERMWNHPGIGDCNASACNGAGGVPVGPGGLGGGNGDVVPVQSFGPAGTMSKMPLLKTQLFGSTSTV